MFLIPILWGGHLWFWKTKRTLTRAHVLPALLVIGCMFTILFLEFFHIRGDIGRMNFVFKFYYQIWWILAGIAAVVFINLAGRKHLAFTCVSGLLLAGGLVYPFTALPAKVTEWGWSSPKGTLNGFAYLRNATLEMDGKTMNLSEDLEMMLWLRTHATPGSVLLEGTRPLYQWGGRISWHTGLPTVLGWDWHMRQQRPWPGGDNPIYQRQQDIDQFFNEADPAILDRYQVDYVIIGQLERVTYDPDRIAILESFPQLKPVFRSGDSVVYQVQRIK